METNTGNIVGTIFVVLIALALGFLLMLVIREIVMWYWKINERISNQKEIIELLKEQNELLKSNTNFLK